MNKIKRNEVLPHAVAILVFLVVTITFFSPIFFENKMLNQFDIQQHSGSTKDLYDYRDATGEEGLWATRVFSGMPAYLISTDWNDEAVVGLKKILSLFLTHPICNIYLCLICYYILLLSFRVRPYLSIAGALAFGLSSYMIIGLSAGHNARIGAIAFMPLVMAGIHLAFSGKRMLGFGVTAAGLSLHLRETHLQITYYLLIIVLLYGLVQMVLYIRSRRMPEFLKNLAWLVPAVMIAAGTFAGQFWAISEFTPYSYRGSSELVNQATQKKAEGLDKSYAFEYSYGIAEPMTLVIPNYYGGSSSTYLVQDQKSKTYQALVNSGDQQMANQLAQYSSAYWGPQINTAPYYGGAIIAFLFVLGIFSAERKYSIWLVAASVLSIMMSWGESFGSFNYFLFDHLPGYNKFRSVTFSLIIMLFAMPLLGLLGLERLLQTGWNKETQRKLIWASAATIGFCLVMALAGGFGSFLKPEESQLPAWFRSALRQDRIALFRGDAWRSFWLMSAFALALFVYFKKWVKEWILATSLLLLVLIDMPSVDKRFLTKDRYQRKRAAEQFEMSESEKELLKDPTPYRVYAGYDGRPSYFFRSTGGYSGARLRRYQELMDSCLFKEMNAMEKQYSTKGTLFIPRHNVMGMLNVKYFINGPKAREYFKNDFANGPAWFVREIAAVSSPNEELEKVSEVNTLDIAVLDVSKYTVQDLKFNADSLATVKVLEFKPPYIKYESQSATAGFVVFSEVHYPKGWHAKIDGKEVPILRADYVLRALEVPAGKHVIEFSFEPKPYLIGNKITMASGWVMLIVAMSSIALSWRQSRNQSAVKG